MSRFLLLVSFVAVCFIVFMTGTALATEKAGKSSTATYAQRDLKPLDIGSIVLKAEDRSGSASTKSAKKKTKVTSSKHKTKKVSAAKTSGSKKAAYNKSTKSKKTAYGKSKWHKKSLSKASSKKSPTQNKKPPRSPNKSAEELSSKY